MLTSPKVATHNPLLHSTDPEPKSTSEVDKIQLNIFGRFESWIIDGRRSLYGAAMLRILMAVCVLVSVMVNFQDRRYLWGAASGWVQPYRATSQWNFFPFNFFNATDSDWLLIVKLGILAGFSLSLLLGWHTRTSAVVVLILSTSLVALGPTSVDSTDSAVRIMLFYTCLLDSGRRWSLDARRHNTLVSNGIIRRHNGPWRRANIGGAGSMWFGTIVHNLAVVAIGVQMILIYFFAGISKLIGASWRDGTAIYYPLMLENFRPWPALNDLLVSSDLLVHAATWSTLVLQILFGVLLLTRPSRIFTLAAMVGLHLGIGISMGLAVFSLAMMAGDVIFLRDSSVKRVRTRILDRRKGHSRSSQTTPISKQEPTPAGSWEQVRRAESGWHQ